MDPCSVAAAAAFEVVALNAFGHSSSHSGTVPVGLTRLFVLDIHLGLPRRAHLESLELQRCQFRRCPAREVKRELLPCFSIISQRKLYALVWLDCFRFFFFCEFLCIPCNVEPNISLYNNRVCCSFDMI